MVEIQVGGDSYQPERFWRDDLTVRVPIGNFPLSASTRDCRPIYRTMTEDEKEELLQEVIQMNSPDVAQRTVDDTEMIIGTEHIETGAVNWNIRCQCDLPPGTRIYTKL